MLSFVLKNTPLKMCWVPRLLRLLPRDRRAVAPAGAPSNPSRSTPRSSAPTRRTWSRAYGKVPLNVVVMQQDYVRLNQLKRHPRGVLRSLKVGARTMWAKATGKNLVGMGRALIAPLRIGLRQAGVPVLAEHRADRPLRRGRGGAWRLRPRHRPDRKPLTRN